MKENFNLKVIPIHKAPEFIKDCCFLINEEWKRSETARMMSLHASCDQLPTSLVLISNDKEVIGHCKLTPIPSIQQSCFVESVVIKQNLRGLKLGSYLMKEAENYAKEKLRKEMMHLSTKGQEGFYTKLGYKICSPVTVFGGTASNVSHLIPKNVFTSAPTQRPVSTLPRVNDVKTQQKTYMFKFL